MSPAQRECLALLGELGAVLLRSKTHYVYRLPSGRRVTLPSSSSCRRAWKNKRSQLRGLARLEKEEQLKAR